MINLDAFLVALVGFFAAVVGGVIHAWANKNHEIARFERQNRNEAYLGYLSAISRLSFLNGNIDEENTALAAVAEARGRIALFGSPKVIGHLLDVFEHGDRLWTDEARSDVSALIISMRQDSQSIELWQFWKRNRESELGAEVFALVHGNEQKN
ncbi:MAG: hypothetical protein AAGH57_02395 [Pseudomonadota bacterium]